ncbi:Synaptic vesicle 2-related protein like [Argiope bruennichi]|uniref:Synaptic vesicle 2-related protein like n=1 Tax=Argiope bruennichi TaxID=94029 RepID=A0A8T0FQ84_ARGBR|nr:Synaptic vesicle 2-related protein like [Argiope bruennichi]
MLGCFKKNKEEKEDIKSADRKSDPNSEEEISDGGKIPKVTFSEHITSDDESISTKSRVKGTQAKQLPSDESSMMETEEAIKREDTSDLKAKKSAVDKAKRLISEVSKRNIVDSEEKLGKDPSDFSKSFKEIPKVAISKQVALDDKPEMSKEFIDEIQAKQLVSDVWEEALKKSKSETNVAKKEAAFDKVKKVMSATIMMRGADYKTKFDSKSSIQGIPEVTGSKHVALDHKPKLRKKMVTEQQAKQFVSDIDEKATDGQAIEKTSQTDLSDLKRKEVAIDKAKKLISAVSKRDAASEDEKISELSLEVDKGNTSKKESAISKAKLLLSAISQKDITSDKQLLNTETTPKSEEAYLEDSDIQICESIESLKIDFGGGIDYDIQDIVNEAGYGKFQKILFFLCGIAWMIANYELMLITIIGDLVACEWTVYGWQNAFLTSAVFIGAFIGALAFGMLADIFGRKRSLGMSTLLLFVILATTVLSTKLTVLLIFRCLFGFALGGLGQVFLLGIEYYPIKDRGTASIYLTFYWSAGSLLLIITTSFIMHILDSWRWLMIVCSFPVLCLFFAIKWYPESARFYLVSHQYSRAVKQLEQMLEMNKVRIPPGRLKKVSQIEERGNLLSLLRKEYIATTLMLWYICFAASFTYYGIILITPFVVKIGSPRVLAETFGNSTDVFTAQIPCQRYTYLQYVHLFWTTTSEIPGLFVFIVLIERMQRKMLLSVSCIITAILFFMLLINTRHTVAMFAILFFVRASAQASCMLSLLMMSEVYPTTMRAISFGSASAFAVLGGAIVPFVTQALVIPYPIPTTSTTGSLILLAGIIAACLPRDTKDTRIEDLTSNHLYHDASKTGQRP